MAKTEIQTNRKEWPGHTPGVTVSILNMGVRVALRCEECGAPIASRCWRKRNLCAKCNPRVAHEKWMKKHAKK